MNRNNKKNDKYLLIKDQYHQVINGGIAVFIRKFKIVLYLLMDKVKKPLYPIAANLGINWAEAYLYLGNRTKAKYLANLKDNVDPDRLSEISDKAIHYLKKAIRINNLLLDPYLALFMLLYAMGKAIESVNVLHDHALAQREYAKKHQMDKLRIEFIPRNFAYGAIGVLFNLDAYIKANILGLRPYNKPVLLVDPKIPVTNPTYLNYWKHYLTIISDRVTVEALSEVERYLTIPLGAALSFHDKTFEIFVADAVVQKQWHEEKRPPLLTLSEGDRQRGWNYLKSVGIPEDAWFVCLHVREAGWRDNSSTTENFRNATIKTYYSAIETIVSAGGWVIRMGDPISMTPLPSMQGVFDYAHSDLKSDWMDVFCCAECRFCIGTSSGVYTISAAFGVPVLMTNGLPYVNLYALPNHDLFIPRLCYSNIHNRFLTFKELFSQPVSILSSQYDYDRLEIKIIENTEEEIVAVVEEMLDRTKQSIKYSEKEERRQDQFKSITAECGTSYGSDNIAVNARIGNSFLKEYSKLL